MALRTPLSVTPHLYMGDSTGRPLDMGTVYFGEQDKDPEFYPIDLFSDDALTLPLAQPVHTKGGYLYDKGDMVEPHAKEFIYSVKVLDSYGRKVFYKGAMMRNSWNDDVIGKINQAIIDSREDVTGVVESKVREAIEGVAIDANLITDALVPTINPLGGLSVRTQASKNRDFISVKDFGAKGDGTTDDTAAIQAAFDSEKLGAIYFPRGLYKVTGVGDACLTLSKNRNIYGASRGSTIRADFAGAETSLLKIAITDNDGLLDCRGLKVDSIFAFHNGGGKHGLHIEGGMQILNATFPSCQFSKGANPNGHGIYVKNNLAHSELSNVGFDTAYMACYDANVFRKCISFGKGEAITYDCELGVRNNTVEDCTLVNRDGQVKIINGDNIRIRNNQMELAQSYSPVANQSNPATMLHIVGVDRPVLNTIIEDNNFGGGTSLDHSVYIDNAERTVIDKNQFTATNLADVYFTERSKNNILGLHNTTKGSLVNPRNNKLFKVKTTDLGIGNIGTLQSKMSLNTQNTWVGSDFYKNSSGVIVFAGEFNGGSIVTGSAIGTMPKGFTPYFQKDNIKRNLLSYTEDFNSADKLKSGLSVISDTTLAPDDVKNADTLTATTTNASHWVSTAGINLPSDTNIAFSVYLKKASASSTSSVRVEVIDSTTLKAARATINLTAGTATISASTESIDVPTVTITAQKNGFYLVRGKFKIKPDNGGKFALTVIPNNVSTYTSFVGDVALHSVIAWGAQLEIADDNTEYQRVLTPTDFETVFRSKSFLATTDAGVGTVNISRQGLITVGSLPSNSNVTIQPFQGAEVESV